MKIQIRIMFMLILLMCLISCDHYAQPIDTFLGEYSEKCVILACNYPQEYKMNSNNFYVLNSSKSVNIECLIRNPQLVTLYGGFSTSAKDNSGLSFAQQDLDKRFITITIDKLFIYNAELDYARNKASADITTSLYLRTIDEASNIIEYEPYSFYWHVNSKPPVPQGIVVSNNVNTNTYLLCFDMCDMNGIHADIVSIKINDQSFDVQYNESNLFGFSINDSRFEVTSIKPDYYQVNEVNGIDFNASGEYTRPVYFDTNDLISDEDREYTITIKDRLGLTNSVTVSIVP